jgi:hypothetical protein
MSVGLGIGSFGAASTGTTLIICVRLNPTLTVKVKMKIAEARKRIDDRVDMSLFDLI